MSEELQCIFFIYLPVNPEHGDYVNTFFGGFVDCTFAALFKYHMGDIITECLRNNSSQLYQFSTDCFTSIVVGGSNFNIGYNI